MDWTDEIIAQLKLLWAEGHSTAEIGRRMGISKNAVVGKAHRLSLPPRPSPIRREEGEARPPMPKRVTGPTLPPLSAPLAAPLAGHAVPEVAAAPASPAPVRAERAERAADKPAARAAAAEPAPRPELRAPALKPVARPALRRTATCCWPVGEPGTAQFHFCDADAVQGRPYCTEHVQLAYVKVRERREDAA